VRVQGRTRVRVRVKEYLGELMGGRSDPELSELAPIIGVVGLLVV